MQRYLTLAIVIATCADATVFGQNVLRLYPEKKLQADAARWGEQIQAEYRETILPQLTARGAQRTRCDENRVSTFRAQWRSVFLLHRRQGHDLPAGAFATLLFGSLRQRTPGSMLTDTTEPPCAIMSVCCYARRHSRRALRFPPVFRTLGVPDNAREESAVANRVDRNFGNTIVFLLAHELGHALKKHDTHSRDPIQKRRQEIEADAFAIEVMRRIGQVPLGVEFWFDVERIGHVQGIRRGHDALGFPRKQNGRNTSLVWITQ